MIIDPKKNAAKDFSSFGYIDIQNQSTDTGQDQLRAFSLSIGDIGRSDPPDAIQKVLSGIILNDDNQSVCRKTRKYRIFEKTYG